VKLERDTGWNAAVILAAIGFAWLCTSPSAIALINWDNAAYIAEIASGGYDWSHLPWSSHLGVGQVYKLGVWLAQLFGGSVIDGFRLVNALVFAATSWVLFDTSRRIGTSRLQAAVLTLLWATAWVNLHYHLILEDNFLFLAPCAALLRISVLRVDSWRVRDSLLCGVFCLLGFLGSYQALPYMLTAAYAALLGPGRRWYVRFRDAALVGGGFLGSLLAWMTMTVVTSRLTWKVVAGQVMLGPTPNFMPRSPAAMVKYIFDGRSVLETFGNGVFWNLSFHAYNLPWGPPLSRWWLGLFGALVLLTLFIVATRWSWKTRHYAPHILAATLLMLAFVTSLHKDAAEYTGLKRYDFVPLILVFLIAFALVGLRQQLARRWLAAFGLSIAGLVIVAQLALGLRWTMHEHARYQTTSSWNHFPHPEPMQFGREGKSWFRYFRDLDRQHRDACTLVLSYGEIADSTWNFDITGSLYSEVHAHLVLVDQSMMTRFAPTRRRVVPRWAPAESASIPACAWVSEPARELLARVGR
jgi:hypothetical protein